MFGLGWTELLLLMICGGMLFIAALGALIFFLIRKTPPRP